MNEVILQLTRYINHTLTYLLYGNEILIYRARLIHMVIQ